MNPDRKEYLNLTTKPGKVTAEEAGWHLGFNTHEIPILTGAGMLQPLGNPADNGVKFFLSKELDQLCENRDWYSKACDTVIKYWKDRNLQRPTRNAKKRWPHRYASSHRNGQLPKPRAVRPKIPKNP